MKYVVVFLRNSEVLVSYGPFKDRSEAYTFGDKYVEVDEHYEVVWLNPPRFDWQETNDDTIS